MNNNYNYAHSMMMKIKLSEPDNKGGCLIYANFESTLDFIKQIDMMTLGAPKIIYLIGWQYLGHDDKYPAFFEVNDLLKRAQDATGLDSLLWLMAEAKKYNTILSVHINLSDAYPDSPLWQEYIDKDLILKNNKGELKCTGEWNGNKCYQVRFAEEVKSGMFYKRVDKLFDLLPLAEIKTLHIDAFFARKGLNTTIASEKAARRMMIEYLNGKGVDVTSEFLYRETESGRRMHYGDSDVVGMIASYWKPVLNSKEIIKYQADKVPGGKICNSLTLDKNIQWLIYGGMQGEDIILEGGDWQKKFLKEFVLYNLPYLYLNNYKRIRVKGIGIFRSCQYNSGIVTNIIGHKIIDKGNVLKHNNELCLPIDWRDNSYIAYSEKGGDQIWYLKGKQACVYKYDHNGIGKKMLININANGTVKYCASNHTAYLIEVIL